MKPQQAAEYLALGALVGIVLGSILAFSIVGSALAFVVGRWCAKLLGWY